MPDIRLLQSICKKLIELLPVVLYCIDLKTIGVTYFSCLLEQSIWWRGRVKYLSTVLIPVPLLSAYCFFVFVFWGDFFYFLCVFFRNTIRLPKSLNSNALMDMTCVQTVANILAHQKGVLAVFTYIFSHARTKPSGG